MPASPTRPFNRNSHRDETSALEYISETLLRNPDGVSQNVLVKHHDPMMVERILDRLLARGLVHVSFDRKAEVGAGSRVIRLAQSLRK